MPDRPTTTVDPGSTAVDAQKAAGHRACSFAQRRVTRGLFLAVGSRKEEGRLVMDRHDHDEVVASSRTLMSVKSDQGAFSPGRERMLISASSSYPPSTSTCTRVAASRGSSDESMSSPRSQATTVGADRASTECSRSRVLQVLTCSWVSSRPPSASIQLWEALSKEPVGP